MHRELCAESERSVLFFFLLPRRLPAHWFLISTRRRANRHSPLTPSCLRRISALTLLPLKTEAIRFRSPHSNPRNPRSHLGDGLAPCRRLSSFRYRSHSRTMTAFALVLGALSSPAEGPRIEPRLASPQGRAGLSPAPQPVWVPYTGPPSRGVPYIEMPHPETGLSSHNAPLLATPQGEATL